MQRPNWPVMYLVRLLAGAKPKLSLGLPYLNNFNSFPDIIERNIKYIYLCNSTNAAYRVMRTILININAQCAGRF